MKSFEDKICDGLTFIGLLGVIGFGTYALVTDYEDKDQAVEQVLEPTKVAGQTSTRSTPEAQKADSIMIRSQERLDDSTSFHAETTIQGTVKQLTSASTDSITQGLQSTDSVVAPIAAALVTPAQTDSTDSATVRQAIVSPKTDHTQARDTNSIIVPHTVTSSEVIQSHREASVKSSVPLLATDSINESLPQH